jgi:hypothetical protein
MGREGIGGGVMGSEVGCGMWRGWGVKVG